MNRFRRQLFSGLFALIVATVGAFWLNAKYNTLDRQIDELVYELYGLSAAEIAIVEGSLEKHPS